MDLTWLAGWQDFLKGFGFASIFILFLLFDRRDLKRERAEALTRERAANENLVAAKDVHAAKLYAIMDAAREDAVMASTAANSTADGMRVTGEGMKAMAGAYELLAERIPERRRTA